MKKVGQLILMVALSLVGAGAMAALNGAGTAESPFQITSLEDLQFFRDSVNGGNTYAGQFVQVTADIDMSGVADWAPIGNGSRSDRIVTGNTFAGTFDGNGKTISNLKITSMTSKDAALGLFGAVKGGTVKNFTLTGVTITVPSSECAGGAVGLVTGGTVSGITVSGAISVKRGAGGIVGRMCDAVTLTWEGSATGLYAVEYTDSLEEGSVDWQQASDPVTGVTVTLPGQTAAQRFYRVRVMTGVAK